MFNAISMTKWHRDRAFKSTTLSISQFEWWMEFELNRNVTVLPDELRSHFNCYKLYFLTLNWLLVSCISKLELEKQSKFDMGANQTWMHWIYLIYGENCQSHCSINSIQLVGMIRALCMAVERIKNMSLSIFECCVKVGDLNRTICGKISLNDTTTQMSFMDFKHTLDAGTCMQCVLCCTAAVCTVIINLTESLMRDYILKYVVTSSFNAK